MNKKNENKIVHKKPSPYFRLKAVDKKDQQAKYEFVVLLRPDVSTQDAAEFFKKVSAIFTNFGGEMKSLEYWGLRRLYYRIKKQQRAHYYYLAFVGNETLNKELQRVFGISESVIRHMITRVHFFVEGNTAMLESILTPPAPTKNQKDTRDREVVFDQKYVLKQGSQKTLETNN